MTDACGNTKTEAGADHTHTCWLPDGHEDTGEFADQYHDCGICRRVGWTDLPDTQQPGSGESG